MEGEGSRSGETPSKKRKLNSDASQVELTKKSDEPQTRFRSEFWHDDGNIVIQIENTYFKLYRGQLSALSTLFADLLQDDGKPVGSKMNGCPLYRVEGTTAEDFESLLTWIEDT